MRYPVFLIGLLIILFSCKSPLVITSVNEKNIHNESTDYVPDSSIISLVAPYKDNLEADMSKVIAISDEQLVKKKPESKLTDLMANILMEAGDDYCKTNNKNFTPDVAFMNYAGLRSSLPKGKITVGDIYELMPFENKLVLLQLSGADMIQFVAKIAEHDGDGVAGMKLGIKNKKVSKLSIGGRPFNKNEDYWLVTNDYIAGGGDGMKMLANRKTFIDTGLKIRDLVIENLEQDYKAGKKIDVKLDGRIYNEQ